MVFRSVAESVIGEKGSTCKTAKISDTNSSMRSSIFPFFGGWGGDKQSKALSSQQPHCASQIIILGDQLGKIITSVKIQNVDDKLFLNKVVTKNSEVSHANSKEFSIER